MSEKQLLWNNSAARQSILLWEPGSTSLFLICPELTAHREQAFILGNAAMSTYPDLNYPDVHHHSQTLRSYSDTHSRLPGFPAIFWPVFSKWARFAFWVPQDSLRGTNATSERLLHTFYTLLLCPTGAPSRSRKNSLKLSASSAMSLTPAFLPADRISISAPSDRELIPAPSADQLEMSSDTE